MKQLDAFKLADGHWVRKRKGFRVHCREMIENTLQTTLMPSEGALIMDSEIAAWRLAHRLSAASGDINDRPLQYTEIYVVDDRGQPIPYYKTGQFLVLNPES